MSKLFKLKKWLTVPEAARHLSIVFGEEVSEADVLRLSLDGHLQLSVNFVNHARARCGKVVPIEGAKRYELPSVDVEDKEPVIVLAGLALNQKEVLELDDQIVTLDGVFDLPMIGCERLDVEHMYQQLTGGPAVTLINLEGAFAKGEDGSLCQLQESFDKNEFQAGSLAQLERIEADVAAKGVQPQEAEHLRKQHAEQRKVYLEKRKKKGWRDYYPAGTLPQDSVLVVRVNALIALQERLSETDTSFDRPLGPRAETTYKNIIGALLDLMLSKAPTGRPRSAFNDQSAIIEALLAHHGERPGISKRTLEEKFAAAKRSLIES